MMNATQSIYNKGVNNGGFGSASDLGTLASDRTYEEVNLTITLPTVGKYMVVASCSFRSNTLSSYSGGVKCTTLGQWTVGSWHNIILYYVEATVLNQTMTFHATSS